MLAEGVGMQHLVFRNDGANALGSQAVTRFSHHMYDIWGMGSLSYSSYLLDGHISALSIGSCILRSIYTEFCALCLPHNNNNHIICDIKQDLHK
jgi:hypothetical protein